MNQIFQDIQKNLFLKISQNKKGLKIKKTHYDNDYGIYLVEIILPKYDEEKGTPDVIIHFEIILDFNKLTQHYNQLKLEFPDKTYLHIIEIPEFDPATMIYDFDDKFYFSDAFEEFLDHDWHNIILHLKAFNYQADNYEEIAKLLNNFRGGISAKDYGI